MTNLGLRILLPIISGYLVYLTLARQLWPFKLPIVTSARPRWMLGCWLGAAAAISVALIAHFAFGSPQTQLRESLAPAIVLLATMVAGGLIGWYHYRRKCLEVDEVFERDAEIVEWTDSQGTLHLDYADSVATENSQAAHQAEVAATATPLTATARNQAATKDGLADTSQRFVEHARELARQQYNLRCEAEKNLRITRRALLNAEGDYQNLNSADKEKLANLEERLQDQIRLSARSETKLLQEVNKVGELQHKLASAGDLMLQAKSEVRRNLDARARALITARKAVNFAKRSIESRERTERKMKNLQEQLKIQSNTTSTLVKSLERSKNRCSELEQQIQSREKRCKQDYSKGSQASPDHQPVTLNPERVPGL